MSDTHNHCLINFIVYITNMAALSYFSRFHAFKSQVFYLNNWFYIYFILFMLLYYIIIIYIFILYLNKKCVYAAINVLYLGLSICD